LLPGIGQNIHSASSATLILIFSSLLRDFADKNVSSFSRDVRSTLSGNSLGAEKSLKELLVLRLDLRTNSPEAKRSVYVEAKTNAGVNLMKTNL
jgi:hypothetical protein